MYLPTHHVQTIEPLPQGDSGCEAIVYSRTDNYLVLICQESAKLCHGGMLDSGVVDRRHVYFFSPRKKMLDTNHWKDTLRSIRLMYTACICHFVLPLGVPAERRG